MKVCNNAVVTIDYTLTNDAGDVLDSSQNGEPLAYLHGAHNIIPGLESALLGREKGESLTVHLEPAEAYGEHQTGLIQTLPQEMFQGVDELAIGMEFHAQTQDGGVQAVRITDIQGDQVTIDGNHPLAGVPLNFDVNIVDVRESSDEEQAHGHIHGLDDSHQH